jgi:hypothetical protein
LFDLIALVGVVGRVKKTVEQGAAV